MNRVIEVNLTGPFLMIEAVVPWRSRGTDTVSTRLWKSLPSRRAEERSSRESERGYSGQGL
jgi:hypothetical protein